MNQKRRRIVLIISTVLVVTTILTVPLLNQTGSNTVESTTGDNQETDVVTETQPTDTLTPTPESSGSNKEVTNAPSQDGSDSPSTDGLNYQEGSVGDGDGSKGTSVPTPSSNVSVDSNAGVCCSEETTTHSGS